MTVVKGDEKVDVVSDVVAENGQHGLEYVVLAGCQTE